MGMAKKRPRQANSTTEERQVETQNQDEPPINAKTNNRLQTEWSGLRQIATKTRQKEPATKSALTAMRHTYSREGVKSAKPPRDNKRHRTKNNLKRRQI